MLYSIVLRDAPGSAQARKDHHDGHIAHFRAHKARLALAGPLSSDAGEPVGSLVVIKADSEADARAFIQADPFFDAGVWEDIFIAKLKASTVDAEALTQP
jgi:hypothetical protein